ncbi:MFS transporter [Nocardia speluncae]|uniref:MFS transporter n=1 Tax=Nocardia speluncae TaxID=419477 RepID=A0A846XD04_9NOCA|nr:MFS transporter [Nocardia speluncae]NKY31864.1 MFS transporter [Nocardia speluncae]
MTRATTSSEDRAALESRTYRKITWRLMPFLMACFVASFLDRVNVGFAKLQMLDDLGFSEAVYGLGAGLFFVGYFIFEVPSNLYMHRIGAKQTIMRIMLLWGVISSLFAFVETPLQFYILRFLLGAAEAGFFPGVILLLTYWFPSRRRAKMTALFYCAIPLSGIIGGPLSGLILTSLDNWHGYAGWQWMFVLEAIPTLVLGIMAYWLITDTPQRATWLTDEQRELVATDIAADVAMKESYAITSLRSMLRNKYVLILIAIAFCQSAGTYGLSFWLPSLINQTGVSNLLHVGLLSAIPYTCAVVALLVVGAHSDRTLERKWHVIVPFFVGAGGLAVSVSLSSNVVASMISLCFAAAGCITITAMFWNLPPAFFSGLGAASGIALINSCGAIAGFLAPYMLGWIKTATGHTDLGIYALTVLLIIGALFTLMVPARIVNR